MKLVEILRCGTHAVIVASMLLAPAVASSNKGNWKTECIGRFQVSMPGEVEVALTNHKTLTDRNVTEPIRFKDGSVAGRSQTPVDVTDDISFPEFIAFGTRLEKYYARIKSDLLNEAKEFTDLKSISDEKLAEAKFIKPYKTNLENTISWQFFGGDRKSVV